MGIIIVDGTHQAKILYVKPTAAAQMVGFRVEAGKTIIGYAQDMAKYEKRPMTNHVHVTLTDGRGRIVDPRGFTVIDPSKK